MNTKFVSLKNTVRNQKYSPEVRKAFQNAHPLKLKVNQDFIQSRKEPGTKYDVGKPRYDLIPAQPLLEIAEVFTLGAEKYGDRNWEEGMSWGRIFRALMTHLWKFWAGIDIDPEWNKRHLAHAGCCMLMLMELSLRKPEFDNRPKVETK